MLFLKKPYTLSFPMDLIMTFVFGAGLGGAVVLLWNKKKEIENAKESSTLKTKNEELERKLEEQKEQHLKNIQEKEKHFKQIADTTKTEFENIAQRIFLETTKSYREESNKNLSQILSPFKSDMEIFKKSIQGFESKEHSFQQTIKDFKEINSKMKDEYTKLTQALKGDIKTQGQLGEVILENILKKSGLREGEELFPQGKGLIIKDEEGNQFKPDAVVKLPDNKCLFIDAKVSFVHYRDYLSANSDTQKQESLKKFLNSLNTHIKNLSDKKYHFAEGLKPPDFTLMFIPNDGVFSLATQSEQDLFEKAWEKSIVIVSPSTLYATLRTVAYIWKIERQNKNAEQIAKQGGLLYDKFSGFVEDMKKIDSSLSTARGSYDQAFRKLKEGPGNILQKIQKLKQLGVRNKKEIPSTFSEADKTLPPKI